MYPKVKLILLCTNVVVNNQVLLTLIKILKFLFGVYLDVGLNLLSLEPIHKRFGLKTQQLHESGSKSVEFQDTYFGQAEYTIFIAT